MLKSFIRLVLISVFALLAEVSAGAAYSATKKFVCSDPNASISEIFADDEGKPFKSRSAYLEGGNTVDNYLLVGKAGILVNIEVDWTDEYYAGYFPNIPSLTNATVFLKPIIGGDKKPRIQLRVWDVSFDGAKQLQSSECKRFSDDVLPQDVPERHIERANRGTVHEQEVKK